MNPTYLDSRYGALLLDVPAGSSLLREEAAPAASGTAGAAPESAEMAAWIEWDTRARRGADQ